MIDVEVDIRIDEQDAHDDPLLDMQDVAQMIAHTRAQLIHHIRTRLARLDLTEPLTVRVTGIYSLGTEQLELSYHIDTDSKPLMMAAIQALHG
jgi:hypothetical protein